MKANFYADLGVGIILSHRLRIWVFWFVLVLPASYLLFVLIAVVFEDRIVFRPVSPSERWFDPSASIAFQELTLPLDNGSTIHARWYPFASSPSAVLYCHPRGGNLSIAMKDKNIEEWQRRTGRSILIFDYPGYGKSTGAPTELGCYRAAEAAYRWLTGDAKIQPLRLLIVGRSLGTGVAVDLASRVSSQGLVLISPYTTLPEAAQFRCPVLPARLLMRNRFDSLVKIARCNCPILIVHGTKDTWVPSAHAERLLAAAHSPKLLSLIPGADHSDKVLVGFFDTLDRFLGQSDVHFDRPETDDSRPR
jgi:uncharacterized protein